MLNLKRLQRNVNWQWSKSITYLSRCLRRKQGLRGTGICVKHRHLKCYLIKKLMPPVCTRLKAKPHLLVLRGFSWEFSNCWFQITCNPGMTESQTRSALTGAWDNFFSFSSTYRLQLQQFQTLLPIIETKPRREVLLWRASNPNKSSNLKPTAFWFWLSLPEVLVPQWHAALPRLFPLRAGCPLGTLEQKWQACAFNLRKRAYMETAVRRSTRSRFK